MSLNARVYRSRAALDMNVEALGAVKDDRTGEYYFPTPEHDGKFPPEAFMACEFWIGNAMGVAELDQELRSILGSEDSLLQTECFYSGTHSGDVIELELLLDLENEIRELSRRHGPQLSDYLKKVLSGMLELIEAAKRENNPIVFV